MVDNAIVVIENITRYLEKGIFPEEAAFPAARVNRIHRSLHGRFADRRVYPHSSDGRHPGPHFREFAVTLSVAVAISLVVSLTTTPDDVRQIPQASGQKPPAHLDLSRQRERPSTACTTGTRAASAGSCGTSH